MDARLKSAVESACEGAIPVPLRYEMRGGGMAVLVPIILHQDGRRHGEFPAGIEFEMVVFDAYGNEVKRTCKVFR